jgi:putative ABC transport system permease protein
MIRTMRAVGVSARTLIDAMLCELLMLTLIAGGAGMVCGYLMAAALLSDVAASLDGLYGAQVAGRLALDAKWWISGLSMAALGALAARAACSRAAFRMAPGATEIYAASGRFAGSGFAVALAALLYGKSLYAGFVLIAGVLLGVALLLPLVLAGALWLGEKNAEGAVTQWFWADSRQQLSGLSLALMALLLALSTNVGVGTMVEGFRKTFTAWLDQRLVAELYFEAVSNPAARRIEAWLEKRLEVTAILPVWRAKIRLASWPVDVVGLRPHETYRVHFPMLSATEEAWDSVRRGGAVLVSEQLARRLNLGLGATVDIPSSGDNWRAEVVGIYSDYGNPKGQLRVDLDSLIQHWPDVQRTSYSLRVTPNSVSGLIRALQAEFGPEITRIVDQASLKELSTSIFERTFAVTAALNTLTLLVSAIALLASLLTLRGLSAKAGRTRTFGWGTPP